jgi:hypothetical protein
VRRYTQVAGAPAGGAANSTPVGPAGNTSAPSAPPLTNIPALDAYIRLNYASEAWLLDVPEVRNVLEVAVGGPGGPLSTDQIQAKISQTAWWRHTSQAQVAFDQLQNQTPEELNFNDPGSKASAALANVTNIGQTMGIGVGPWYMKVIALQALQFGWSNQQIQSHLGGMVKVTAAGQGVTSNDPQLLAAMTKSAGDYLVNPGQQTLQNYAEGIATGQLSQASWQAYLQGQAAAKYPSMAAQIKQGMTPTQIVDPLRQDAAHLMEVAPDAINFISNPTYAKILTYRPPDTGNQVQPIRTMTNSEMETYLRGTDGYAHTQGARNTASDLEQSILTTFGKVAGA